jgi:hypothetical protein
LVDDAVEEAVATARAFASAAGANRVVLLIDRGRDVPALMVEVDAGGEAQVTDAGSVTTVAETAAPPRPLPHEVRAIPATAITLDLDTGELSAPIGSIEHLARALHALATSYGGRTVATAEIPTRDPGLPITIAVREGEPAILSAGDEQYELPG